MRHLSDIRHNGLAADILSNGKCHLGSGLCKFGALQQFTERNRGTVRIGHLDSHGRLSWYGRFDADIGSCQTEFDIIGQSRDLTYLHTLFRNQFISGNTGA